MDSDSPRTVIAKKKVLHIITGLNAGGAEMLLVELVRNSSDLFDSEVLVLGPFFDLLERVEASGITVHQLKMDKSLSSLRRAVGEVKRLMDERQFDVLHAHMYHPLVVATLYRMFNKKVDIAFTPNNVSFKSRWRELFVRLTKSQRKADILFGESMIKGIYRDDFKIMTNAIDTKKFSVVADKYEKFTFLHVGRLEPQKNHLQFMEMIREVRNQRDNFRVCLIGKGPLEDEIRDKVRKLDLEDTVELWGYRTDIPEICARSHVFAMPSLWEGLPVAMLEAGASGMLVCCTPVGSIPDYIDDSTGIVCQMDDFSGKMIECLDNYDQLKVRGDVLQETIRAKFDIRAIAQEHFELYQTMGVRQAA